MKKGLKWIIGVASFVATFFVVATIVYCIFVFISGIYSTELWGGVGRFTYVLFGILPAVVLGTAVATAVLEKLEE